MLKRAAAADVPACDAVALKTGRRAVFAASIGNALEWYDFSVYAFFAIYIGHNFFAQGDAATQLLNAFLAFGVGFIVRPLGALVLGAYGDSAGRKAALTVTILTMAAGTGIIACAPSFSAIAFGAPLLIVCGRLLQGFSAGGEIGGASAFLIEHAPPDRRGKYASWLQASMALSNILSALVATSVTLLLSSGQIDAWGWRIPFIIGLAIAPVGFWLRKTLAETPTFCAELECARRAQRTRKAPLLQIVRDYPWTLLVGIGFSTLWAVCTYTLVIFMPVYVQRTLHFEPRQAFLASLIGNCFMAGACVFSGALSDRFGRRVVAVCGALLMLVGVYPLLAWLSASHSTATLVLVQTAFCLMVAIFTGVAPSILPELFPTRVRSTGMSLSYNTAVTLFGGFAPAILTWLTSSTNNTLAPAVYVMAAAGLALISIACLPAQAKAV